LGAGTGVGIGTQPASGYALDINGKLKANNIRAAKASFNYCGSDACSYSNIISFPSVTLTNAICTATINTNSATFPLVNCQVTSIVNSGGNTNISVTVSNEPSNAFPNGAPLNGAASIYVIGFTP